MTTESRQRPELQLIRELYEHNTSHWSSQITLDQGHEDLYFNEHEVTVTDTKAKGRKRRYEPEKMQASEGGRIVDLIVSLISHPSTIAVQYTGDGVRAPAKKDAVELALNAVIDELNPPTDSPILRQRWQMVTFGRSAKMIVPGHMYWSDYPGGEETESLDEWYDRYNRWRLAAPIPIVWVDLPPQSTFPASFGRIDEELLSWMTVSYDEIARMFGGEGKALRERRSKKRSEEATLAIYSNCEYLAYAVLGEGKDDDEELRVVEHKLGTPAIRIISGLTSGKKVPGKYWLGCLYQVKGLIKSIDDRLSDAATASKFDAFPILKWHRSQDIAGEGAQQQINKWMDADIWDMDAGDEMRKPEDVNPVYQPQFGDKTLNLAQFARALAAQISGATEALEGTFGPPGQPAWSRRYEAERGEQKHALTLNGVTADDLDAAEMIIRSVVTFGEKVPVQPKQGGTEDKLILDPDELREYRCYLAAGYKLNTPVDWRADVDMMVSVMERAKAADLPIDPEWAMEKFGLIEQPWDHFKNAMRWKFVQSPQVQAVYMGILAREMELDLATEEGMPLDELGRLVEAGQLPPDAAQKLALLFGAQPRTNGGMSGATRGGIMAASPYSREPGGPQPVEGASPL